MTPLFAYTLPKKIDKRKRKEKKKIQRRERERTKCLHVGPDTCFILFHVSLDRYSQDVDYTSILYRNKVSRGVCQALSVELCDVWYGD